MSARTPDHVFYLPSFDDDAVPTGCVVCDTTDKPLVNKALNDGRPYLLCPDCLTDHNTDDRDYKTCFVCKCECDPPVRRLWTYYISLCRSCADTDDDLHKFHPVVDHPGDRGR
jgi:hypothetical protein